MLFKLCYNSTYYYPIYSPFTIEWAFFMFFSVPRLLLEQCSTVLISPGEQSNQPYGLKNRLQKPLFSGSGWTCSGTRMRLFSITSGSFGGIVITSSFSSVSGLD